MRYWSCFKPPAEMNKIPMNNAFFRSLFLSSALPSLPFPIPFPSTIHHSSTPPYSSQITQVTFPPPTHLATGFPTIPNATSLSKTTTLLSYCMPTASKSPNLFIEKWRGNIPPEGQSCMCFRVPSFWREKVERESEGMEVVLWGEDEGEGMWKEVLLRLEIIRKRLSGCVLWC